MTVLSWVTVAALLPADDAEVVTVMKVEAVAATVPAPAVADEPTRFGGADMPSLELLSALALSTATAKLPVSSSGTATLE